MSGQADTDRWTPTRLGTIQLVSALALWTATGTLGWCQLGLHKDPLSWDRNIRGHFQKLCLHCHDEEHASGNVNLARYENPSQILDNKRTWIVVLEMLRSGQMPPDDEEQPSDEQRQEMITFLEQTFASIDCQSLRDPGRPLVRRLNHTEYNNAVEDLVGLELNLADAFPPDPTGYGFDNIAEALSFTTVQIEHYHAAAKKVVAAILAAKESQPAVYHAFFQTDGEPVATRDGARAVISRVVQRAFRGPIDEYYVNRLLRIYDQGVGQHLASDEAVGQAITAVLLSPRFLIRIEEDRPGEQSSYRVSDYELASRLSFFVWSRPPDLELTQLAEQGRLQEDEVVRHQVMRMLHDDRSRALVDNFFAQWLDLRRIDVHQPDRDVFPEFDEPLRQAMRAEVSLLLREIIQADRPITWLIDSPVSYVNQRLAEFYNWSLGNVGDEPARVDLLDSSRGGVLTSAAVLMLQSDPARTNIPRRGNFVAGQILGMAPPPPPADVPPLEVDVGSSQRTLREMFEMHRSSEDCKSCHQKIDPLGFSLENFDGIGRWREEELGFPVDASAEIRGQSFVGPQGLKKYILSEQDALLRNVASNLLIYALGRGLQATDECVLDDMVAASKANDLRFSSLVLELVSSLPFTHRKNSEE